MKTILFRLSLLLAFVLPAALPARAAEDLGAVKARMEQRLSKLDALKAGGAIGENNRGLVEVRGGGGDAAAVVADENRDREAVYAAIAHQTGASADSVGRARAKQIATNSAAGVWLQHEDGSWYKK
ncbi:MAG TPA: YdbL family protein [Opitutaceae bacterium]|nr:YdbL family protein [Opitutaceae bacterium]